MARNARKHGVLIYLWIHFRFLFVWFLSESISFNAKKHQFFINVFIFILKILYILKIQRFFTNISTAFFPSFNRDIEKDEYYHDINSTTFYWYFKITVGGKLEGWKFEKDRLYFFFFKFKPRYSPFVSWMKCVVGFFSRARLRRYYHNSLLICRLATRET